MKKWQKGLVKIGFGIGLVAWGLIPTPDDVPTFGIAGLVFATAGAGLVISGIGNIVD